MIVELKVIKCRNIGMIGHDYVEDDYWNEHSYCSFELSNKKVIACVFNYPNSSDDDNLGKTEYRYIDSLNYKFQKDFLLKLEEVSKKEIDIIQDFYKSL